MKNSLPQIVVLILSAAFFFSYSPSLFSDEAATPESTGGAQEDFSSVAQNDFPGLATTTTPSAEAGTNAPSGQAADPAPLKEDVSWNQYTDRLGELRSAYEKGDLTARQYNRQVRNLKREFRRSEERRGHGYDKHRDADERPIDTRAIEIEKGQINVGGSSSEP